MPFCFDRSITDYKKANRFKLVYKHLIQESVGNEFSGTLRLKTEGFLAKGKQVMKALYNITKYLFIDIRHADWQN